ncbi:MAG: ribosomal protein methylthiotransferase [Candidatus Atribacteria bacterium]|nr:ribosomal protein methylthiotransferase [Candidatus Atribacteria bacterium]
MRKIFFTSLGCDKNLVDSEVVLGNLVVGGYNHFSPPEEAEILILNTCAFIDSACREAEEWIKKYISWKEKDPGKKVVVMGCYPERFGPEVASRFPEVDWWVGVNDFSRIVQILQNPQKRVWMDSPWYLYDEESPRLITESPHYAFVKIAEGCNRNCSYCLIPQIKGPLRSRTISSIEKEIVNLLEGGTNEIILVAQDLGAYGLDRYGKPALSQLLARLEKIVPAGRWVRLLYLSPEHLDWELIETIAQVKSVVHYLDLPLQHVNPVILQKMNRRYRLPEIRKKLERMRLLLPDIVIRTTFLVGFPGEDQKSFQELLSFVQDFAFERMGAFIYSDEPGSQSARLQPKVPLSVAQDRFDLLMETQQKIMDRFHQSLVGKEIFAIIDQILPENSTPAGGCFLGRTYGDAPEVDAQIKIFPGDEKLNLGQIVKVKVTKAETFCLEGKTI